MSAERPAHPLPDLDLTDLDLLAIDGAGGRDRRTRTGTLARAGVLLVALVPVAALPLTILATALRRAATPTTPSREGTR